MAQPLPIQSWKVMGPWVVSAVKFGASELILSDMIFSPPVSTATRPHQASAEISCIPGKLYTLRWSARNKPFPDRGDDASPLSGDAQALGRRRAEAAVMGQRRDHTASLGDLGRIDAGGDEALLLAGIGQDLPPGGDDQR